MEKENIKKELKEIAPKLNEFSKEQPFRMPPNYFNKMQEEVLGKISQQSSSTQSEITSESFWDKLSLWLSPKPRLAFAGLAAIALAAFLFFPNGAEEVDYFSAIDDNMIETYFEENVEDLSTDLLADLASAYDIEDLNFLDEGENDPYINEIIDLDDVEIEYLLNEN